MPTSVLVQAVPSFLSLSLSCLAIGLSLSTWRSQRRLLFDRHVHHPPLFSSPLATYSVALIGCVYTVSGVLGLLQLGLGSLALGAGSGVLQAIARFGGPYSLALNPHIGVNLIPFQRIWLSSTCLFFPEAKSIPCFPVCGALKCGGSSSAHSQHSPLPVRPQRKSLALTHPHILHSVHVGRYSLC